MPLRPIIALSQQTLPPTPVECLQYLPIALPRASLDESRFCNVLPAAADPYYQKPLSSRAASNGSTLQPELALRHPLRFYDDLAAVHGYCQDPVSSPATDHDSPPQHELALSPPPQH